MQKYDMAEFWARSSDHDFDKSEFKQTLDALPQCTPEGPWVAGGALRRLITGKPVDSDIDFFFRDEEQYAEWVKDVEELGAKKLSSNDHQVTYDLALEINDWPKGESSFADAVRGGEVDPFLKRVSVEIQGVHFLFYRDLEQVLDSFDFTICQLGYDGDNMYVGDYTLWDLARKKLALHKLSYGLSTVRRLLKYQTQGFNACSGCLTQILESVARNPELIQSDIIYVD